MNYIMRFSESIWRFMQTALWERGDVESAAVLLARQHLSGETTQLVVEEVMPVPAGAYRERRPDFLELDPVWMNECTAIARRNELTVLTVHTHLTDGPAWFSWADDRGDGRLMPALSTILPGMVPGALNVTRTDALGRAFVAGGFDPARITVAGRMLEIFPRAGVAPGSEAHSRQVLALGRDGQATLASLRIAIVGLGGTGSFVSMTAAHLGIRSVLLIDGDRVERSNLSRIVGASPRDIGMPKVAIAKRQWDAVAPDANVELLEAMLVDPIGLGALAGVDLVFCCVDMQTPRALLNQFAYRMRVPIIDMGSAFRVDDTGRIVSQGGKVAIIGPGRPCLWCWGDLDPERLRIEALSKEEVAAQRREGYIQGADAPQPSVITFNGQVAMAAMTEALRLVTGFAGADEPPDRLNFDFRRGTVSRVIGESRPACPHCGSSMSATASEEDRAS